MSKEDDESYHGSWWYVLIAIVLIAVIVVLALKIGNTLNQEENQDNLVENITLNYNTSFIYWNNVDLPDAALKLLGNVTCYHADCYQRNGSESITCYLEIGKSLNDVDNTCYIGDGNMVTIDCDEFVCSPSVRTKFDLDVTEKSHLFYYNHDLEKCCVVSNIKADRVTEYMCWDSILYDCVSSLVGSVNTTTDEEGVE
jgi:hypothetical protein